MRYEPVQTAASPSAVDVCDGCGGLWIDWFDGEIQALAVEAEVARLDRRPQLPAPRTTDELRPGSSTCPRCMQPLVPELHRFEDATDDELVNGVELLRCTECVGSFVPRPSVHLLLGRALEPRTVTLWEALVALVERLIGKPPR